MRRKLSIYAMFVLFACAYATLDRVPQGAVRLLRGSVESVVRYDETLAATGPEG